MRLGKEGPAGAPGTRAQLTVVSAATVLTVLAVIFVVQGVRHQPVLVTSLASSVFLLDWQPLNEVIRIPKSSCAFHELFRADASGKEYGFLALEQHRVLCPMWRKQTESVSTASSRWSCRT